MVHGFSDVDKSKRKLNVYYDSSDGKLYAYNSNEELEEIKMGLPNLDYSNPLNTFSSSGNWTATQDCYIGGKLPKSEVTVSVNSKVVAGNENMTIHVVTSGGSSGIDNTFNIPLNYTMPFIKVSQGDIVNVSAACPNIYAFKEI